MCDHDWVVDIQGSVRTSCGEYDDDLVEREICIKCGEVKDERQNSIGNV